MFSSFVSWKETREGTGVLLVCLLKRVSDLCRLFVCSVTVVMWSYTPACFCCCWCSVVYTPPPWTDPLPLWDWPLLCPSSSGKSYTQVLKHITYFEKLKRFDLFWCNHVKSRAQMDLQYEPAVVWSIVCSSVSLAIIIRRTVFSVSSPSNTNDNKQVKGLSGTCSNKLSQSCSSKYRTIYNQGDTTAAVSTSLPCLCVFYQMLTQVPELLGWKSLASCILFLPEAACTSSDSRR